MDAPRAIHPFACQWTLGLLPPFDYCEHKCEHECPVSAQVPALPRYPPQQLNRFTFLPATHKGLKFSTSLPACFKKKN